MEEEQSLGTSCVKLAGLGSRVTFLGCQVMNQGTAAWYLSVPGSGNGWSHSVTIRGGLAYFTRAGVGSWSCP